MFSHTLSSSLFLFWLLHFEKSTQLEKTKSPRLLIKKKKLPIKSRFTLQFLQALSFSVVKVQQNPDLTPTFLF